VSALSTARRFFAHTWTRRVVLTLTLVSIGSWLVHLLGQLDLVAYEFRWQWLFVAALIQTAYVCCYSLMWHVISGACGIGLPVSQSAAIWMFSIFGKYLPGRVLGLATRMAFYETLGKGGGIRAGAACALESAASITGGVIAAIALAPFCLDAGALGSSELLLLTLVALMAMVGTPFAYRFLSWIIRSRLREARVQRIALRTWVATFFAYTCLWLVWGTVLVALVAAFDSSAIESPLTLIWLYQLAGISGILAFFAPSGFGVREGALLAGLLTLLPPPLAALITVVARLLSISVEALAIGTGFLMLEHRGLRSKR